MISLVTGAPGAGKTFYAVRVIAESIAGGKPVATNITLKDGWERAIAMRNPFHWICPPARRRAEAKYRRMLFVSADLEELFRVRLAGDKEGRGVMVLDEAHTWLNSRTWDQSTDGRVSKAESVAARLKVVRFFSAHRHLGWDIYAITQDAANIDRQVRSLFEYHIRLKNLKRAKIMGIPIVPVNVFLAIWLWNDNQKTVVKRQTYRLTSIAKIYATHALANALDYEVDGELIHLPTPLGGPAAATGEAGRPAATPREDDQAHDSDPLDEGAAGQVEAAGRAAVRDSASMYVSTAGVDVPALSMPAVRGLPSDALAKVPSPMDPAYNAERPGGNRVVHRSDADAAAVEPVPEL